MICSALKPDIIIKEEYVTVIGRNIKWVNSSDIINSLTLKLTIVMFLLFNF